MARVTFLGAAQEVTGSCLLLESEATGRIILDCGMHQGGDAIKRIQKDNFDFDIQILDAVILSHAHLDHSGLLPKLVSKGFSGPIFCTSATADLLRIMLNDAAGIYGGVLPGRTCGLWLWSCFQVGTALWMNCLKHLH